MFLLFVSLHSKRYSTLYTIQIIDKGLQYSAKKYDCHFKSYCRKSMYWTKQARKYYVFEVYCILKDMLGISFVGIRIELYPCNYFPAMQWRRIFGNNIGMFGFGGIATDIKFIISISVVTASVTSAWIYEKAN